MDKLISVIIPIYNAEKYLKDCLESLIKQTYINWECILIDDCSTDASGIICEEFKTKDSRFHVCHQEENKGVSAARNAGLATISGEYVCFVDSDDMLPADSLEKRIEGMDNDTLVVSCYEKLQEDNTSEFCSFDKNEYHSSDFIEFLFINSPYGYQGYLWNKLFSTEVIKNNNLSFDEDLAYNEDRLFILKYLLKSEKVIIKTSNSYIYRINSSSAMGMKVYNEKLLSDKISYDRMESIIPKSSKKLLYLFYKSYCERCRYLYKRAAGNEINHTRIYKKKSISTLVKCARYFSDFRDFLKLFLKTIKTILLY